jgi:uncharacterized protein YecA (UPF0149 family)
MARHKRRKSRHQHNSSCNHDHDEDLEDDEEEDGGYDDEDDEIDWETPLVPIRNETKKIGRNEPCPCGSRKKYKKCCING